jgi:hypothetical protein
LLILSILVWLVPARAIVQEQWLAVVIGTCVTVGIWTLTAFQLRANLNERGGYLNDRSDYR